MMRLKYLLLFILLIVVTLGTYAQKKQKGIVLSGFVIDSTSATPVAESAILIDNEKTQVTTDMNGFYRIKIKPGAVVITVVTPDKQVKSELIKERTQINFAVGKVAGPGNIAGKKEYVDDGYRKIDIKNSGTSVSKSDVIDTSPDEFAVYDNVYDMIRSRVPGVEVNGTQIRIRGITSMTSSNEPLFVVDGLPVSSIDHVNPRNVQSINILKGTSAAIYGSRGSNGVIVIATKNGQQKR